MECTGLNSGDVRTYPVVVGKFAPYIFSSLTLGRDRARIEHLYRLVINARIRAVFGHAWAVDVVIGGAPPSNKGLFIITKFQVYLRELRLQISLHRLLSPSKPRPVDVNKLTTFLFSRRLVDELHK